MGSKKSKKAFPDKSDAPHDTPQSPSKVDDNILFEASTKVTEGENAESTQAVLDSLMMSTTTETTATVTTAVSGGTVDATQLPPPVDLAPGLLAPDTDHAYLVNALATLPDSEIAGTVTGDTANGDGEPSAQPTDQPNENDEADTQDATDSKDLQTTPKKGPGRPSRGRQSASGSKPSVGTPEWHQIRRDNHKEVERRRRENINHGIDELVKLLPIPEKNKGKIIHQAADYIRQLKENEATNVEKWTLEKLLTEQAINELSAQVDMLKAENEQLRKQVSELEGESAHKKAKTG
ncbi:basic helix-loop-helix protein [Dispira parvispora]|uniref:Basic helix-loop-helix protein n=1 Tax=Dispira parvispora TaxID=1520584 RepID=A0A9W8APF2_9FUNG|nr:basic helix-loop-helix protein [Dispira parvispora]